jgi:hypothetical protein
MNRNQRREAERQKFEKSIIKVDPNYPNVVFAYPRKMKQRVKDAAWQAKQNKQVPA